ncbi:soluble lytic murein transglycosylase-like protein [Paraburkholderia sp. GAS41]|uniref:lytic transglycosylase domain-containing protein n=1 Tax=Paraburkholderia sp. GAS41 TaxID=3035134 RepID=UPI003D1CC024
MQSSRTQRETRSRVTRATRLVGLALGVLALSFGSAIEAAEAPSITVAPGVDTHVIDIPAAAAPTMASEPGSNGGASALVEIATILSGQFRVARGESTTIAHAVLDAANRFAMSPVLLLGVIATESGFNRRAVSSAGALGLMQVLPSAHPQLVSGGKDLSDPAVNVTIGSSILRGYLDAAGGDLNSALSRYNGGGKGYAQRVAFHMQQFARFFPDEKTARLCAGNAVIRRGSQLGQQCVS